MEVARSLRAGEIERGRGDYRRIFGCSFAGKGSITCRFQPWTSSVTTCTPVYVLAVSVRRRSWLRHRSCCLRSTSSVTWRKARPTKYATCGYVCVRRRWKGQDSFIPLLLKTHLMTSPFRSNVHVCRRCKSCQHTLPMSPLSIVADVNHCVTPQCVEDTKNNRASKQNDLGSIRLVNGWYHGKMRSFRRLVAPRGQMCGKLAGLVPAQAMLILDSCLELMHMPVPSHTGIDNADKRRLTD